MQYRDLEHLGNVFVNGNKVYLLSFSLKLVDHRCHVHGLLVHLITRLALRPYKIIGIIVVQ